MCLSGTAHQQSKVTRSGNRSKEGTQPQFGRTHQPYFVRVWNGEFHCGGMASARAEGKAARAIRPGAREGEECRKRDLCLQYILRGFCTFSSTRKQPCRKVHLNVWIPHGTCACWYITGFCKFKDECRKGSHGGDGVEALYLAAPPVTAHMQPHDRVEALRIAKMAFTFRPTDLKKLRSDESEDQRRVRLLLNQLGEENADVVLSRLLQLICSGTVGPRQLAGEMYRQISRGHKINTRTMLAALVKNLARGLDSHRRQEFLVGLQDEVDRWTGTLENEAALAVLVESELL